MSVAELQELEEVKALLTRGHLIGVLTHAEVNQVATELDMDEPETEELQQFLEKSEIEIVEELPRTGTGKLNRPELRKKYP